MSNLKTKDNAIVHRNAMYRGLQSERGMGLVMTNKLKLYVWEGVLTSHRDGIMFALAHSVKEAREAIQKKEKYIEEVFKDDACLNVIKQELQRVKPRVITEPEGFTVWGGD